MTTGELLTTAWDWHPSVVAGCGALGAFDLAMCSHARARMFAGLAGAAVLLLALVSPLDVLADEYLFTAHMLQHLALLLIVPCLLLLGLPDVARRRTPSVPPAVAWIVGVGTMSAWHAPRLYDAAVRVDALHVVQHLTFLGTGVVFWWPVLGPARETRLGDAMRVVYLVAACVASSLLGIAITLAPVESYGAYASPVDSLGILPLVRDGWGMSRATDQVAGGLLMWVGGCLVYVVAICAVVVRWLDRAHAQSVDDRRAVAPAPLGPR